jgi:hypothetical protein
MEYATRSKTYDRVPDCNRLHRLAGAISDRLKGWGIQSWTCRPFNQSKAWL